MAKNATPSDKPNNPRVLQQPARSPADRLLHIRDSVYRARSFVGTMSYTEFRENDLVFYAVTRCLEIVSEASRRLPDDLKTRHPDIPWHAMAGAGNIYRHGYEDVQQRLVWGVLQDYFPALLVAVELELSICDDPG